MINSTTKLSMVAMRVWVKCIQSTAIRNMAANAPMRRLVTSLPSRYMLGSINTPASAPAKRQPKGVMPKIEMEKAISTLPSGGCEVS